MLPRDVAQEIGGFYQRLFLTATKMADEAVEHSRTTKTIINDVAMLVEFNRRTGPSHVVMKIPPETDFEKFALGQEDFGVSFRID